MNLTDTHKDEEIEQATKPVNQPEISTYDNDPAPKTKLIPKSTKEQHSEFDNELAQSEAHKEEISKMQKPIQNNNVSLNSVFQSNVSPVPINQTQPRQSYPKDYSTAQLDLSHSLKPGDGDEIQHLKETISQLTIKNANMQRS